MPVTNNYSMKQYSGNSSGRNFNFPFRCFCLDDLKVELIDSEGEVTPLTLNTDFTVTGGLDNSGGMITYPLDPAVPPLTAEEELKIYRSTPMEQSIDYPIYQQSIENAFDKEVMLLQEVAEDRNRSIEQINAFGVRVDEVESSTAAAVATASNAEATANNAATTANTAASAAEAAEQAAEAAAEVAAEALLITEDSSHAHMNKAVIDEFTETESETPAFRGKELALADGSNASTEGYRELVGIPEVEADVAGTIAKIAGVEADVAGIIAKIAGVEADVAGIIAKQERILTGIAPQTIVQGNTCSIPAGWAKAWCDAPAVHIVKTGDQEVTIKAGLQVVGGYKGRAILSKVLESDHSIDLSFATGAYSFAIYADINEDGDFTLFREWNASLHPLYVSNIYKDYSGTAPAMWYNPAECTSRYFTAEGVSAEICRVFIGEVYTDASGNVHNICNYQHGTSCIIPLNAGNSLSLNSWYYLYKPYRYLCFARAEVFAGRWNQTNWIYNGSLHASYGTVAMTIPSSSTVWVRTGSAELGSIPPAAPSTMPSGGITEGLGRLVIKRAW